MPRFFILIVLGLLQTVAYAENTVYVDIDRISVNRGSGAIDINTGSNLLASTSACKFIKRVRISRGSSQIARDAVSKQYALIMLAKSLENKVRFSGSCDVGSATFVATYITMR